MDETNSPEGGGAISCRAPSCKPLPAAGQHRSLARSPYRETQRKVHSRGKVLVVRVCDVTTETTYVLLHHLTLIRSVTSASCLSTGTAAADRRSLGDPAE